jgi:hypothetical protein
MKTFDEGKNCLVMRNLRDLKTHIRETSDVIAQWFILVVSYPLEVVFVSWLLAGSDEIDDERCLRFLATAEKSACTR